MMTSSLTDPLSRRAWLGIALLAVIAGLAQIHPLFEPDLWWHLWVGEQMVEQGSWAIVDHSSFTQDGWSYVNAEWIPSLALLASWSVAGAAGPTLLTACFAVLCTALVGLLALRLAGQRPWAAVAVAALVAGMTFERFTPRPQLFFLTYLPLALLILELPAGRKRLLLLAGLQLLWAHSHGSHVMLPGLVGARALGWWWHHGREGLKQGAIAVGVLSFIALLLGPQGVHTLTHVLHHASSDSVEHIGEMRSPTWTDLLPTYLGARAWLAVASIWAVFTLLRRRVRFDDVLVALAGVALQYTAVRFHAAMGILLVPLLLRGLDRQPARSSWLEPLVALLLVVTTVPLGWKRMADGGPWARPGLGLWQPGVAKDVADLLETQGATGHLWNFYDDGGYLMWRLAPDVKIAMDGRAPAFHTVDHHALWRQSVRSFATLEGMDERWVVDHVLVDRDLPLCVRLEQSSDWRLVHLDARRSLFTQERTGLLPSVDLQALPPCAASPAAQACPGSHAQASSAWDETTVLSSQSPDSHYPWLLRLRLLSCSEGVDPGLASGVVDRALAGEIFADDLLRAALLLLRAGDAPGALTLADRALELGGGAEVQLFRGRVLLGIGEAEAAAEALLEAAREQDDGMNVGDRLLVAQACHQAGLVEPATDHALRVAATGNAQALALLSELLPALEGQRADDARGWVEAWSRD